MCNTFSITFKGLSSFLAEVLRGATPLTSIKKITQSKKFYLDYVHHKNDLLQNIDFTELDKIINLLKKCFKYNNIVYTCGNGGSSSLADHFACDFIKQSNNKTNVKRNVWYK